MQATFDIAHARCGTCGSIDVFAPCATVWDAHGPLPVSRCGYCKDFVTLSMEMEYEYYEYRFGARAREARAHAKARRAMVRRERSPSLDARPSSPAYSEVCVRARGGGARRSRI